jgi:antirestriction protein
LNNKQKTKYKTMEQIKIYVGTYHKYNCGSIEGAWIDVTELDKEEFYSKCKELHKDEQDPEFHFQDWETIDLLEDFISESGTDPEFWELKEQIKDFSNEQIEALTAYQNLFGTIDVSDFEDRYFGHFEGFFGDINTAFGEHMLQEMGELEQVPQHLRYYIDSEAYGRDLLINDFCEFEGFVFRNC